MWEAISTVECVLVTQLRTTVQLGGLGNLPSTTVRHPSTKATVELAIGMEDSACLAPALTSVSMDGNGMLLGRTVPRLKPMIAHHSPTGQAKCAFQSTTQDSVRGDGNGMRVWEDVTIKPTILETQMTQSLAGMVSTGLGGSVSPQTTQVTV